MSRILRLSRADVSALQLYARRNGRQKKGPLTCPTEFAEQVEFFAWADANVHRYPELAFLYAIPNGEYRSWNAAKRLKASGVKPGYPDVGLDVPRQGFHGLRLELKRLKGSKTDKRQLDWHEWLRSQGYRVDLCKGADAAKETCIDYLTERAA